MCVPVPKRHISKVLHLRIHVHKGRRFSVWERCVLSLLLSLTFMVALPFSSLFSRLKCQDSRVLSDGCPRHADVRPKNTTLMLLSNSSTFARKGKVMLIGLSVKCQVFACVCVYVLQDNSAMESVSPVPSRDASHQLRPGGHGPQVHHRPHLQRLHLSL